MLDRPKFHQGDGQIRRRCCRGHGIYDLGCIVTLVVMQHPEGQGVTAIAEAVKRPEDVAKWNPSKAKAIMEKVESKAVAYAGASLGEIAEAEAKEWITAQVKGWFDEKKNGLKDELLPDISFVGGMLDAIALYVELAQ